MKTFPRLVTHILETLASTYALQYLLTVFGSVLMEWLTSQPDYVSRSLRDMKYRSGPEVVFRSRYGS